MEKKTRLDQTEVPIWTMRVQKYIIWITILDWIRR